MMLRVSVYEMHAVVIELLLLPALCVPLYLFLLLIVKFLAEALIDHRSDLF
jgi:hypothetical protein